MIKKRTSKNPIPLIVEEHPDDYDGYPFITLVQYDNKHLLTIIDNASEKQIKAYILDLCGPESIDEEQLVAVASHWYDNHRDRFPISFQFSRLGISDSTGKIYRTFNIEYVTRVIGPLPKFDMTTAPKIRRRRRKAVPPGVEVSRKIIPIK